MTSLMFGQVEEAASPGGAFSTYVQPKLNYLGDYMYNAT